MMTFSNAFRLTGIWGLAVSAILAGCFICGCRTVEFSIDAPLRTDWENLFDVIRDVPDGYKWVDLWLKSVPLTAQTSGWGKDIEKKMVEAIRMYARQVDWWSAHITVEDEMFARRYAFQTRLWIRLPEQKDVVFFPNDRWKYIRYHSVNRMVALATVGLPTKTNTPFDQWVENIRRRASEDLMILRHSYDFVRLFIHDEHGDNPISGDRKTVAFLKSINMGVLFKTISLQDFCDIMNRKMREEGSGVTFILSEDPNWRKGWLGPRKDGLPYVYFDGRYTAYEAIQQLAVCLPAQLYVRIEEGVVRIVYTGIQFFK